MASLEDCENANPQRVVAPVEKKIVRSATNHTKHMGYYTSSTINVTQY